MERFLYQCAKYISDKHKEDLFDVTVVFPGRRAGVFFLAYLQQEMEKPTLAPEITTIGEFISSRSDLLSGEKLELISVLYQAFKKHTHTQESFDEFYFWGEILLNDFNDIDRYLVDAKDLFTNISDIREIETIFDYLSEEQKKALAQFWGSIWLDDKKLFKEKYVDIWSKLFPIYVDFKESLYSKGIGFGGMIDRMVTENFDSVLPALKSKKIYFVGLNALNACEKSIFSRLQAVGKAEFLWDFDRAYLDDSNNLAGYFLRNNLRQFAPPADFVLNDACFSSSKNIEFLSVSSSYAQTQEIPTFVERYKENISGDFDNTAIVLADESLLFPVLSSLPDNTESINVTMGYPVKNSTVFGLLNLLVNLIRNTRISEDGNKSVYHRFVTDVLNHQLSKIWENQEVSDFLTLVKKENRITIDPDQLQFSEFHTSLFAIPDDLKDYTSYFLDVLKKIYVSLEAESEKHEMLLEVIFSIYQSVEKLGRVVQSVDGGQVVLSDQVYFRLFGQYLGNLSVAFEGEPLRGVQVMGILETRCLDFENLIILGLNENKWPRTFTAPSFIPHNIRKGFGLPGIDEQDAMYAYYFYRLVQRAGNISATYNVNREGIQSGELSRYGYQLKYDSVHTPKEKGISFDFHNPPGEPISVKSSDEIVRTLMQRNSRDKGLSPTAIITYLQCNLRFYFRYCLGLPEPDEVLEEMDGATFGNVFHDSIEQLYKPFVGKVVESSDLEVLLRDPVKIQNEIRKQIGIHFLKRKGKRTEKVKLEGKTLLFYENIHSYLSQLIKQDKECAPFQVVSLENKYCVPVSFEAGGNSQTLFLEGKVDRIDQINGRYRILDYKTGNVGDLNFKKIDDLFIRNEGKVKKEILQALIYAHLFTEVEKRMDVYPAIYVMKNLFKTGFDPNVKMNGMDVDFSEIQDDFLAELRILLGEMFSPQNTFTQSEKEEQCKYCPYNKICRRFVQ